MNKAIEALQEVILKNNLDGGSLRRLIVVEKQLKAFNALYETIKQKRDSALEDLNVSGLNLMSNLRLKGEIEAYNDVLTLIENVK